MICSHSKDCYFWMLISLYGFWLVWWTVNLNKLWADLLDSLWGGGLWKVTSCCMWFTSEQLSKILKATFCLCIRCRGVLNCSLCRVLFSAEIQEAGKSWRAVCICYRLHPENVEAGKIRIGYCQQTQWIVKSGGRWLCWSGREDHQKVRNQTTSTYL